MLELYKKEDESRKVNEMQAYEFEVQMRELRKQCLENLEDIRRELGDKKTKFIEKYKLMRSNL